jgi:lipopolysaccharide/colanic/teichoic acid biosynthesis glycosyltransferase
MTCNEETERGQFHPGDNCRVTKVGKILRRTKIDELPELFNVLKGDMSIVGPRPEVDKYVKYYPTEFKEILKFRPGLSDFASVKYRDEEVLLACDPDPGRCYLETILPDKLRLAKKYTEEICLKTDLQIMLDTIKSISADS